MIKPKDKAKELFTKFSGNTVHYDCTKQCALIAVDEIVENVHYFFDELSKDGLPNMFGDELDYWESVKYEINNL
jgi:hypothetical protein